MRFPKIDDVAAELRRINKSYDADEDGIDVRLQVYPDGDWAVRWGLSDYDQDHRGYWGSSSVPGSNRRFDSKDVARDLIDQAKEEHAMGGEGEELDEAPPAREATVRAPHGGLPSGRRYVNGWNLVEKGIQVWVSGDEPTRVHITSSRANAKSRAFVEEAVRFWWGSPLRFAWTDALNADIQRDPLAHRARETPHGGQRKLGFRAEARRSAGHRVAIGGRGEVIPSRIWRNRRTGATASPYGAVPWTGAPGDREEDWEKETVGWTIRWEDGTTGIGRQPFATRSEAEAWLERDRARREEARRWATRPPQPEPRKTVRRR